jgi:CRP/FNR family cyclic AMP-dependent transcriptional regulator
MALIEYCRAEAVGLIRANLDIGETPIAALIEFGTLSGEQVDETICRCIAARSMKAERRRRIEWKAREVNAATFRSDGMGCNPSGCLEVINIEQRFDSKSPNAAMEGSLGCRRRALWLQPNWSCQRLTMEKPTKDKFSAQAFLEIMGAGKAILNFEKNENVFAQGDVAETVYYIQKGKFKVTVVSERHKEAVVGILGPGQFFGEGCMNGHRLRIATTTAIDASVVTSITKEALKAALHEQPALSELFLAYLLTRNSRIEGDLIELIFNSSERRFARMLLLLSQFGREGTPRQINPNISHETLADMIGTTESHISDFLNKFRKLGFISYNGHIEVNSSLLDAVLRDKPELSEDE